MIIENDNSLGRLKEYNEAIVKFVFPFVKPPPEVINGTYIIVDQDPKLHFPHLYHQASSSLLLTHRPDGKIVVPAIALNEDSRCFDFGFIGKTTLPRTKLGAREYASWWSSIPRLRPWIESEAFSPEKGLDLVKRTETVRKIYTKMTNFQYIDKLDKDNLRGILSIFIGGMWLNYYCETLPEKILKHDESAVYEAQLIFVGFKQKVQEVTEKYYLLCREDQYLISHGFNFIIQAKQTMYPYLDPDIPKLLQMDKIDEDGQRRSPFKIAANTRGIGIEDIEKVFLPDEISHKYIESLAISKLHDLGIGDDKISRISNIGTEFYTQCDTLYGLFSNRNLVDMIRNRQMVYFLEAGLEIPNW